MRGTTMSGQPTHSFHITNRQRSLLSSTARVWLILGACAAIAVVIVDGATFRVVEAHAARLFVSPWTRAVSIHDVVIVGVNERRIKGFRITAECTASLLTIPLLLLFSVSVARPRVLLRRALLGLMVGVAIVFAANQLRITVVMLGWLWGGSEGLGFTHGIVGTIISVAALLFALLAQLKVTARRGRGGQA